MLAFSGRSFYSDRAQPVALLTVLLYFIIILNEILS